MLGKSKVFLGLMLLVIVSSVFLTFARNTSAAIISPPFSDEIFTAGNSYTGSFTIFFTEQDPNVLYLSLAKMEINDVTGAKRAVFVDSSEPTLANWVGLDRTSVTKPEGVTYTNGDNAVLVNYVVDVPRTASPGGTYAVVIVSNVPLNIQPGQEIDQIDTGVGVGADITYQMIAFVDGDVVYRATMSDFRTKDNQWLFPHLPVQFETVFQNGGNVHVIPRGNIEIFQGGKIANIALNSNQLRVFPDKTRLFQNVWSEEGIEEMTDKIQIQEAYDSLPDSFFEHVLYEIQNFRIGQYTAKLQGFAGKQQFGGEVTFWIIPWHLLLTILVIVLVIYGGWRVKKKFRGAEYVGKESAKYKRAKSAK